MVVVGETEQRGENASLDRHYTEQALLAFTCGSSILTAASRSRRDRGQGCSGRITSGMHMSFIGRGIP